MAKSGVVTAASRMLVPIFSADFFWRCVIQACLPLFLLYHGVLRPLVQFLMDRSVMAFETVDMSHLNQNGLRMQVKGVLKHILIPSPMTIAFRSMQLCTKREDGTLLSIANLSIPTLAAQPGNKVPLSMSMEVHITSEQQMRGFCAFSKVMLQADEFTLVLKGVVDCYLFGFLPLRHFTLQKEVTMPGMQGLKDITMQSMDVIEGNASHLVMLAKTTIQNPSRIAMHVDGVTLNMYYGDLYVGRLKMDNMLIGRGACAVEPLGHFAPAEGDKASANVLLTRYLCQHSSVLQIRGDSPLISSIPYLHSALSTMDTSVIMPPLPISLLRSSTLLLQPSAMLSFSALSRLSIPSQIHLCNPLSVPIKIVKITGAVYHKEVKITQMDQDLAESPISLAAQQDAVAPQHVYQKLEVGPNQLWSLFNEAMNRNLDVFISTILDVYVGDYLIKRLKYEQDHVPAELSAPFL